MHRSAAGSLPLYLAVPKAMLRRILPRRLRPRIEVRPGRSRRRIQNIYYVLALFDVIAVVLGLALSHHLGSKLHTAVAETLEWRHLQDQIGVLRWHAGRIDAAGNELFENGDSELAETRLGDVVANYRSALDDARRGIERKVPEHARAIALRGLGQVDASIGDLIHKTRTVIESYHAGDWLPGRAMAAMDRNLGWVIDEIDNSQRVLHAVEMDIDHRRLERVSKLRTLEYVIAAMVMFIVLNVTLYGHALGRAFQRHLERLARLRRRLERRVADRTARLRSANESIGALNEHLRRSLAELSKARDELSRQHEALLVHNAQLEATLDSTMRGICLFDGKHRLVMHNRRYMQIYGLPIGTVRPGMSVRDILLVRARFNQFDASGIDAYCARRDQELAQRQITIRTQQLPDERIVEVSVYPTADGGWVSMHDDVTDEQLMQRQIVHLAHHDALTGLTNRLKFQEELETALARAERGDSFAVLALDLDEFKQVNDTLGHPIGDKLLKAVSQRLTASVRKSDVVARIGGDEFAIIQATAEQPQGATALASRLIEEISQPYEIDDHQIIIGTSVGIVIAPQDGAQADALIKNADLALYRAKSEGRGSFRLFETEMNSRMQERRRMEVDLRQALARNELELFYQPLIDAATLTLNGFEALLRWRHPERGLIPPMAFIPIAEEMGLMGAIGAWVLRKGCADAVGWPGHLRVAINVSPAQFRTRPLELDVMAAIAASGIEPSRLELEITESVLLENSASTVEMLARLRNCGIKIAMDDFGTGYSSLSYLLRFPFDKIKLDRTFTMGLTTSRGAQSIIQAVVELSRGLGMSTTAEGVETDEQLRRLRDEGCTEVQGYLFSKPVPASEIPQLVARLTLPVAAA